MGEKDIAEKHLEAFSDVFADIINVLLLSGTKLKVRPEDLLDTGARSLYKSADEIHEQERDSVKLWRLGRVIFCMFGLENQTKVDRFIALRVQGYEGGDIRFQLAQRDDAIREARRAGDTARVRELQEMKYYPVVTLVLFYGMGHWTGPKTLLECMDVPEELRPFVNDNHINVVEVAWLTDEQRAAFTSDFRIIADYFYQRRVNKKYDPPLWVIKHVDAVLKLMRALTGDNFFEEAQNRLRRRIDKGEEINMISVFDEAITKGRREGRLEGQREGRREGRREGLREGLRKGLRRGQRNGGRKALSSVVSNMLKRGLTPEQVSDFTALPLEEINKLSQDMPASER